MLFNSWEFVIFFPLVTLLYFALPHRFRWMLLLAASCAFYMFFIPVYILILAFTILVDYAAGISIAQAAGHRLATNVATIQRVLAPEGLQALDLSRELGHDSFTYELLPNEHLKAPGRLRLATLLAEKGAAVAAGQK